MPYKDKQREKEYKREYMRKYCQRSYVMARMKKYREDNRQRIIEHAREYKKRPEIKKMRAEYYQKNKDHILAHNKRNHQRPEIKERLKEYNKKYRKEYDQTTRGKLTRLKAKSNRRENSQNVITLWTKEEWQSLLHNSNGFCPGFKREPHFVGINKLTLDHIHPLSKAEKNRIYTINDIQPLCPDCNSTKGIHI